MSQTRYESEIKYIAADQEVVFRKLSDLNNLSRLREMANNPMVQSNLNAQFKPDQIEKMNTALAQMTFDTDSITIPAPGIGSVTLTIIEREEPKCFKFEGRGIPFASNLWIQLLPMAQGQCKMKITLGAELNFFIKQMVGKKLQGAVNQIADLLARIPYNL